MSLKDHISRIFRKSDTPATTSTPKPKRSIARILSRRSKQSKSSANSTTTSSTNTTSTRSGSQHTARTSISAVNINNVTTDMTASQRLQAAFDAYELRMGATWRVSTEEISPCNTRGMAG